jgi:lipoprotein-releasing system permease protein
MSKLELSIAWRYLRSRSGSRLLSFISVVAIGGVLVGVSALIVIIGVMNGLQNDLREKILVGSPHLRVLTIGEDLTMPDWTVALERIRGNPRVEAAAPFVLTQGLVTAGHHYGEGVMVVGLEPDGPGVVDVTEIRQHAMAGSFRFISGDGERRGVVIGRRLAERLGVVPGHRITMVGFAGTEVNPAFGGVVPRFSEFEVAGTFETGMYEYDNAYIFMAIDQAQEFAGLGQSVTGVEARITDMWAAPDVGRELLQALGGYPYRIVDWQEQNRSLFQALKLEKLVMGVILLLIVIVAAFNIVGTLTMVVKDKTREIGILRAMGLTGNSIRRIFFAQGVVIGVVGTVSGLVVGLITAVAIDRGHLIRIDPSVYFIDHLPVLLDAADVGVILAASIAIAALATLYPAIQASRLYPVEAIREE